MLYVGHRQFFGQRDEAACKNCLYVLLGYGQAALLAHIVGLQYAVLYAQHSVGDPGKPVNLSDELIVLATRVADGGELLPKPIANCYGIVLPAIPCELQRHPQCAAYMCHLAPLLGGIGGQRAVDIQEVFLVLCYLERLEIARVACLRAT